MKILDCESVGTTYASIEDITGIKYEEIYNYLFNLDLDSYYKSHTRCYKRGDELILQLFKKEYKSSLKFDGTCWFHLTRTFGSNKFDKGLLPLGEYINEIWDALYCLLPKEYSKTEWRNFRTYLERDLDDHYAFLYRLKINDQIHWGPFAMLVRNIAFKASEVGNHDYLDVPEIVEDICLCFERFCGYPLLERYKSETKPCIVKFITTKHRQYYLGSALCYLFCVVHNEKFSLSCNTCFDANGHVIKATEIKNIEYIY